MRLLSQSETSIQKRTSTAKFARSPCADPPVFSLVRRASVLPVRFSLAGLPGVCMSVVFAFEANGHIWAKWKCKLAGRWEHLFDSWTFLAEVEGITKGGGGRKLAGRSLQVGCLSSAAQPQAACVLCDESTYVKSLGTY